MSNAYKEIAMSNFVKPDKLKHKFIVGIDFGHGETSADICNIQWDDNFMKLENPESIEIFNNHNATKSVLLIERGTDIEGNMSCRYYVGEKAIDKYMNVKQQNGDDPSTGIAFFSYFKKVPSLMSPEDRDVMMHFMQEIYLQIRKQRTELTDDNHVVYIACPSDAEKWTDKEMAEYAKIALEAGIPLAKIDDNSVGIIRESRAAFIKARQNPNSGASVKEGILLIDFGSSTVDLTYYSSKFIDKPEDGGDNCGASKIEMEIFEHLRNDNELAAECCNVGKSAERALLLGIRQSKEDFYGTNPVELEIDLNALKMTRGKVKGHIEQYYSVEELNTMLSDYRKSIENCFKEYRDNHLQGHPIKLVFLTGGASRMEFVKDIVKEVFSYEGDFYRENNPSLTISNGIAIAGRADLRSSALMAKLEKDDSLNKDVSIDVIKMASTEMANAIVEKISKKYESFSNSEENKNIASLGDDIGCAIRSIPFSTILSDKFKEILRTEVNHNILPALNLIVGDYFPDEKIKNISSSRQISVQFTIDDSHYSSIVSDSVDSISEGFLEGTAKVVGTLASAAVAATTAAVGKIFGEIHDAFTEDESDKWNVDAGEVFVNVGSALAPSWRDKDTKLSRDQRQVVYTKFNENRDTYITSFQEKISSSLTSENDLKSRINEAFIEETTKYIREQVNQVRLMLN